MKRNIPFKLAKNFEKIIEPQLKKPEIAIIELISNSWDANANNVKIQWPEIKELKDDKETFTILDDGQGMTKSEFIKNWSEIGHVKQANLTNDKNKRDQIGKYGRGRLGLFCFSDKYLVSTSKNGKISSFEVLRDDENFALINEIEAIAKPFENVENGTYIECPIEKEFIDLKKVRETLTLHFGADSTFNIYLNGEIINLFDFKDESEYETINFENNEIKIYKIAKSKYKPDLSTYEVVWWVKNRFVEQESWKDLNIRLDSANKKENKYVFIICADFLETEIKSDWTGFKQTKTVEDVRKLVSSKINKMMEEVIDISRKEKKKTIVSKSKNDISPLTPIEQYEIGKFVDEILENCSHMTIKDASNIVKTLTTMETSTKKYKFFENIVNIESDEMDKLTEIVEEWSIDDAYLVLNELYRRLKLIKRLELLVNDPQTKELQQLQPLIKEGLWIFHPKYEGTTRFTSNQSINKVMVELFGVEDYHSENAKKRPDFVVLEESTFSAFSSDNYVDDSEVIDGYDEILLIELKRGGSEIGTDERDQAKKYAKIIRKNGVFSSKTKIAVYVLGSRVNPDETETLVDGNITVRARQYDLIIKTAKNRTFNLIDKIKSVKGISNIGDSEINEVLKEDGSQNIPDDSY